MLLQRTMHLGEDILLARHGGRISELKYHRRANMMEAVLQDGSRDSVSNVLPAMPATGSLDAADFKFLAIICGAMLAVIVPLFFVALNFYADPAHAALLSDMAGTIAR